MPYTSNPAYAMQGVNNGRRAAKQHVGNRGHNHESHTAKHDWSHRKVADAPVVQRLDLIAIYNQRGI